MMKRVIFGVLLLISLNAESQNLVLNPSFENHINCPWGLGQFEDCITNWYNPSDGFPDYFNSCGNTSFGVPNNVVGYQIPYSGVAYAGINLYADSTGSGENLNWRMYVAVKLSEPLIADTQYCGEFFISFAGEYYGDCAGGNVGMVFMSDSVHFSGDDTINRQPQIAYDSSLLLTDSVNWVRISGSFIAEGGEQYLIIGNFLSNAETHAYTPNIPPHNIAYYYIDDVSVIKCAQLTSVDDLVENKNDFNIYPNPANDIINISYKTSLPSRFIISDLNGRTVKEFHLNPSQTKISINANELVAGVYIIEIKSEGKTDRSKLVIMH